jgi:hypothetical protein
MADRASLSGVNLSGQNKKAGKSFRGTASNLNDRRSGCGFSGEYPANSPTGLLADFTQVPVAPKLRTAPRIQCCAKDGAGCSCEACTEAKNKSADKEVELEDLTPDVESAEVGPASENAAEEGAVNENAAEEGAVNENAAEENNAAEVGNANAEPEATASQEQSASALIVDDSVAELSEGQMRKSDFLQQLRAEICRTIEPVLTGAGQTTEGCPYLNYWLDLYQERGADNIEQTVKKYAPDSAKASTAAGYISNVAQRALRAAEIWAATGKITGVPAGVSTDLPGGEPSTGKTTEETKVVSTIQAKAKSGGVKNAADPQNIQRELGDGEPLSSGVRSRMESAFGTSFSHVRAHTDSNASTLSNRVNARAFTVGRHVAFGQGEYKPGTMLGDALIAHELAHTLQQKNASTSVDKMEEGTENYNQLESDADQAAASVLTSLWKGGNNSAQGSLNLLRSGLSIQRCSSKKECQCVKSLVFLDSGAMQGTYGISDYWPGVTPYWGANSTLGQFDVASATAGWKMIGHKFQVVGTFEKKESETGGIATFEQEARLTNGNSKATAGSPGAWFNDMDYTDASGAHHAWGVNAEVGSTDANGYTGVRRTIAPDKYAYTDPPAISYQPGTTNTYRNLEFKIHFRSAPGCSCPTPEIKLERSQEIEVVSGVPTVLKYPGP